MSERVRSRHEPFLLTTYPRRVYKTLRDKGFADEAIFAGLAIEADQVLDPKFRMTIDQHEAFILRALELTDDPHFGIQVAQSFDPATAGVAALAAASSGRVSRALQLIVRFQSLMTRTVSSRLVRGADGAAMLLDIQVRDERVAYFVISTMVLWLDRMFTPALPEAALVREVEVPFGKPPGFDRMRKAFRCEFSFDQPTARVLFVEAWLDQPLGQADPETEALLIEMCERKLRELDAEQSLASALAAVLVEDLSAPPALGDAARRLGVSERGLRRKLASEGTSYQQLLDELRLSFATRLLRETDEPVYGIALELGYDSASNFSRAFKRWSGQAPSAIRSDRPGRI